MKRKKKSILTWFFGADGDFSREITVYRIQPQQIRASTSLPKSKLSAKLERNHPARGGGWLGGPGQEYSIVPSARFARPRTSFDRGYLKQGARDPDRVAAAVLLRRHYLRG
jgi:hypothetical protein